MKKILMIILVILVCSTSGCYFGDSNFFDPDWLPDGDVQGKGDPKYFDQTDYSYVLKNYLDLKGNNYDLYEETFMYFEKRERDLTVNDNTYGLVKDYNYINILAESVDFRFIDELVTPNLYNLMQSSTVIEDFYVPEFQPGATCNSEFQSLSGIYPLGKNSSSDNLCNNYTQNDFYFTLPNQLKRAGYDTFYFHSGYESFYNRDTLIPNYGFEYAYFQEDLKRDYDIDLDMSLDTESIQFFEKYIDWNHYKNSNDTFYINYLSYSAHGGYSPHNFIEEHREIVDNFLETRFNDKMVTSTIKVYYSKLVEFDILVGNIINKLKEEGLYDNTIITLQRDHSPYLLDPIDYNQHLNINLGLDIKGVDTLKNPFIIHIPNQDILEVNNAMTLVDIPPTMLKLLGVKANYNYFIGSDVFSSKKNFIYIPPVPFTSYVNYITDGEYFYSSGEGQIITNIPDDDIELLKLFTDAYEIKLIDNSNIVKLLELDFFKYYR